MFSEATIQTVAQRVGWAEPVPPTAIVLSAENKTSTSGLFVNGIYPLASVENLYATAPNAQQAMSDFQALLDSLRTQAAIKVLSAAFAPTDSPAFRKLAGQIAAGTTTYDAFVTTNIVALDMALGWQIAVDAVRFMLTTPRINPVERSVNLSYDRLKIELEGIQENNNRGILYELSRSLKGAVSILFPVLTKRPVARFF